MALRTTFRPEDAAGPPVSYEVRFGPIVLHAVVANGEADVGPGAIEKPDLIIEATPAFRAVMAQEVTPKEALEQNICTIEGKRALFDRFARMFRI